MASESFKIMFEYPLDATKFAVPLTATVEEHHSNKYFTVKEFHSHLNLNESILPPISIRKDKGLWVHTDSGKESSLSLAAGKAIETRSK